MAESVDLENLWLSVILEIFSPSVISLPNYWALLAFICYSLQKNGKALSKSGHHQFIPDFILICERGDFQRSLIAQIVAPWWRCFKSATVYQSKIIRKLVLRRLEISMLKYTTQLLQLQSWWIRTDVGRFPPSSELGRNQDAFRASLLFFQPMLHSTSQKITKRCLCVRKSLPGSPIWRRHWLCKGEDKDKWKGDKKEQRPGATSGNWPERQQISHHSCPPSQL